MDLKAVAIRVASTATDPILQKLRDMKVRASVTEMGVVTLTSGDKDVTSEFPRAYGFWVRDPKTSPTHYSADNATSLRSDFMSRGTARDLVVEVGGKRYRPGSEPGAWGV